MPIVDMGGSRVPGAFWKWSTATLATIVLAGLPIVARSISREEMVTYVETASPYARDRGMIDMRDQRHDAELSELRTLVTSVAKGQADMNTALGRLAEKLDAYLGRHEGK